MVSSNEEENENTERPEDNVNETVLEYGEDGSAVPEDEDDHRMEDQVRIFPPYLVKQLSIFAVAFFIQ